ncbi:MAG: GntR family transcriptional regulator [Alphaproteobacteria bacterium]|nr:MAG: GntR family transcriptional regulator [Alphaproteobacteria bacterium]
MRIMVDIDDPVPLFTQLITQIKKAVETNMISAGDPLPSIRQLANDLDVNNKTVAKAYRLLERDGILQSKGYRGTFVHPDAKANTNTDLNAWVLEELGSTIDIFKNSGATDSEIRIAFASVMNRQKQKGA